MRNIELLAPAGSVASLHAAVAAGADAVYLGLESFNARRGADNFTLETLGEACKYAHMRGVKVYVTMNTVILPAEVKDALECARQAYRAGADAFIVQDLGLAAELRRTLPEAVLHISTQMNTHNEAGVRAAAKLGAKRITLARELSVGEIAHLCAVAAELGMEIETFAHGALCVCYSGQCFMSSMIGGRSANRGMCAQACRLPYTLHNRALHSKDLPSPGDHLLSPQDLCSVDLLEDLVGAGVTSFKIEGRMKSPEYVSSVVSVYRDVLNRIIAGQKDVCATTQEHDALAASFSRGFTTAYMEGARGNDIMSYQRPNNRGQFIGRVNDVRKEKAYIVTDCNLVPGDVIEFWTKKGHVALTVNSSARVIGGEGRNAASPKKTGSSKRSSASSSTPLFEVPLDAKTRSVRAGDRVFRVRSAEAAFVDDVLEPRIPVTGRVTMRIGEPLAMEFAPAFDAEGEGEDAQSVVSAISRRLRARFADGLPVGRAEGPVIEAARTKAVAADDVYAHVDRLGSTPFVLKSLDIDLDEGVGIGFSQIHRCRAEALESLGDLLGGDTQRILPRVEPKADGLGSLKRPCSVVTWATNPSCARAAKKAGAQAIYVPAPYLLSDEAQVAGQLTVRDEKATYPKECIPVLPVVSHDAEGEAREAKVSLDVWRAVKAGKPVMAESFGDLVRALEAGAEAEAGPHIPATNPLALDALQDFGAKRAWLSPELTLRQIEDLGARTTIELGLTVIGTQELMTTEHCMLMSQGPCGQQCAVCPRRKSPHYLEDRKGFTFPVVTDAFGRSHLYNSVQLDIVPSMPELLAAGVTTFMVDTTLMNTEETRLAVERAVRGLKVAQHDGNTLAKVPDTTSGHLYRGIS